MEKLSNIISHLESVAPLSYQESYDNSGLITGSPEMDITGALICLDSTEAIIDEAIANNCNLVIAHHPILFSGIKKLNGKNYVERTIIKAIKNDVAIYAIHTNLDNVNSGVNRMICDKLGLVNARILSPKTGLLKKLITYGPLKDAEAIKNALFKAGAGAIGNYDECSFSVQGTGSFRGLDGSAQVIGQKGERHYEPEERIEVIFEGIRQKAVMEALRSAHPYEEIAYQIQLVENHLNSVGSGMIGDLPVPISFEKFMDHLKLTMDAGCIRHTAPIAEKVSRIAVCGGSGSFLLGDAIKAGADVFVTADFKYHQFFDADGKIVVTDIGHYESEQFTKELIYELLKGKFTTFALRLSGLNTNPINYF